HGCAGRWPSAVRVRSSRAESPRASRGDARILPRGPGSAEMGLARQRTSSRRSPWAWMQLLLLFRLDEVPDRVAVLLYDCVRCVYQQRAMAVVLDFEQR